MHLHTAVEPANAFPEYLRISPEALGHGQSVKVLIVNDASALAQHLADAMLREIREALAHGRGATLIVPVGPVDQFPILARAINEQAVSCRDTLFINMDEYLTHAGEWLPIDHPLSFRGFMERHFYSMLNPKLAPIPENRLFPDPYHPQRIAETISSRGGVDACFGGIGINGHIAFNEPPEPNESITSDQFVSLPTRVLPLTRETRTINSVTVGGEISVIPKTAVTVGMKEILAANRLRLYCNRPWQSAVVRRVLHGPISPACPASFLRTHPDAAITLAEYVAAPPQIQLR